MIATALVLGLMVAAILGMRRLARRSAGQFTPADQGSAPDGHAVRRLFGYLLLFGLVVVTAVGLAGLLGVALAQGTAHSVSDTAIARSVAFTVVGLPLLVLVGWWSRRALSADPGEVRSFGWLLYLAAAELLALLVALTMLHGVLEWLLDLRSYAPQTLAHAAVWTAVWAGHWWLSRRQPDQQLLQPQRLCGSLVGLVLGMLGLGFMINATLRTWFDLDGTPVLVGRHQPILEGTLTLLLGALTWAAYWWASVRRSQRTIGWLAYVLLAGVAAGLLIALVAGSIALHRVAVWFVGDPLSEVARTYFDPMPAAVATTAVGLLSLGYHRSLVVERRERTEVDRVRDYLLAAVALGATTAGATIVVVALIEAATNPTILSGSGPANTVLAALTLLGVGTPVWWLSWRRGQRAADEGTPEFTSPARRLYLFSLLGVSSLTAVVALLAGTWLLVDGLLQGESANDVLRSVRYPLGILVATAAVAGYHWSVYLRTRDDQPPAGDVATHRFVLLLGVADADLAATIAGRTGATTWAWSRTGADRTWPEDDLLAALATVDDAEVVVLAEDGHLRAIAIDRRPPARTR